MNAPKLFYWQMAARATVPLFLLEAGNVAYDWDHCASFPYKEVTPFGQLPVMQHKGVYIAQSQAIARYCANLGGLVPSDPTQAAYCDMIFCQSFDLFDRLAATHNADASVKQEKINAFKESGIASFLAPLEKMLDSNKFFLGNLACQLSYADVTLCGILYLVKLAGATDCLAAFPNISRLYNHVTTQTGVAKLLAMNLQPWYKLSM